MRFGERQGGLRPRSAAPGGIRHRAQPDGRNLYAVARAGVLTFDRDPVSGSLTLIAGGAGCIGRGLLEADDLAVSPDGLELYVTSFEHPTVTILRRDPTTGISQAAGAAGLVGGVCPPSACHPGELVYSTADVVVAPTAARSTSPPARSRASGSAARSRPSAAVPAGR